jgi:hypothetical protein
MTENVLHIILGGVSGAFVLLIIWALVLIWTHSVAYVVLKTVQRMRAQGYEILITSSLKDVGGWVVLFGRKGKQYYQDDCGVSGSLALAVQRAVKKARERE